MGNGLEQRLQIILDMRRAENPKYGISSLVNEMNAHPLIGTAPSRQTISNFLQTGKLGETHRISLKNAVDVLVGEYNVLGDLQAMEEKIGTRFDLMQRILRGLIDESPVPILISQFMRVKHANQSMCDRLGYTLCELQEINLHDYAVPESRDSIQELHVSAMRGTFSNSEIMGMQVETVRKMIHKTGQRFELPVKITFCVWDRNLAFYVEGIE